MLLIIESRAGGGAKALSDSCIIEVYRTFNNIKRKNIKVAIPFRN